jgi:putative ABC transport system permease protein
MLRNYFTVMLRHMSRHKINAFINIAGLTTGIMFALVIGVYVWGEMQVNKQLKDVDQLYIFETVGREAGAFPTFFAPSLMSKTLTEEYPAMVENYYRFFDRMVKISAGDKHILYQSIIGDTTLISMLGLPVSYGDARTALKEPYSVIITEQVAIQLFGRADVTGEQVNVSSGTTDKKQFRITAVLPKIESNSVTDLVHINAQVFMSFQNAKDFLLPDPNLWDGVECLSYVKLKKGTDPADVEELATRIAGERVPVASRTDSRLELRPLNDYYLLSGNAAVQKMILILSGIAVFILLLASINFINISIAGTVARLKEIGVRKVIGGVKKQIVFQFLSESILLTIFAATCSLIIYELFRGFFGGIMGTSLMSVVEFSFAFWRWFIGGVLLIGFAAGSYPSFLLSAYKTIDSLKGKLRTGTNKSVLSKGLITTQFTISIFVFICSIVVSRQISLFLESDLGYDKSYIITVSSVPRVWSEEGVNSTLAATQEFLDVPQVQDATLSWGVPNGNAVRQEFKVYPTGTEKEKAHLVGFVSTDEHFLDVYKMQLLEGNFFNRDGGTWNPDDVVLNETASKALGVGVGDKVTPLWSDSAVFNVKGIVKDFNFSSLHQGVKPMAFYHLKQLQDYRFMSFRVNPGNVVETVAGVERKWREVFPDDPFDYAFMDDRLTALYKSEIQLKKATAAGTGVMTVIVIVGVLGMVSLAVSRRFKEIGIRKALGASVWNVLRLFSAEYVRIIMLSIALAVPFAWFTASKWLQGFALRVDLSWWMFVIPGVALMILAMFVAGISARKAAVSNPVDALRAE